MLERRVPLVRGANGSLRRPKNKKPIAMDGLLNVLVVESEHVPNLLSKRVSAPAEQCGTAHLL